MTRNARAIVATSIGNMLEWYDFTVYALFAPYIAVNFFPAQDGPGTQSTLMDTSPLGRMVISIFCLSATAAVLPTTWRLRA